MTEKPSRATANHQGAESPATRRVEQVAAQRDALARRVRAPPSDERIHQQQVHHRRYAQPDHPGLGEPTGTPSGQRGGRQQPGDEEQRRQAVRGDQLHRRVQDRRSHRRGRPLLVIPRGVHHVGGAGVDDDHTGDHGQPQPIDPAPSGCSVFRNRLRAVLLRHHQRRPVGLRTAGPNDLDGPLGCRRIRASADEIAGLRPPASARRTGGPRHDDGRILQSPDRPAIGADLDADR